MVVLPNNSKAYEEGHRADLGLCSMTQSGQQSRETNKLMLHADQANWYDYAGFLATDLKPP